MPHSRFAKKILAPKSCSSRFTSQRKPCAKSSTPAPRDMSPSPALATTWLMPSATSSTAAPSSPASPAPPNRPVPRSLSFFVAAGLAPPRCLLPRFVCRLGHGRVQYCCAPSAQLGREASRASLLFLPPPSARAPRYPASPAILHPIQRLLNPPQHLRHVRRCLQPVSRLRWPRLPYVHRRASSHRHESRLIRIIISKIKRQCLLIRALPQKLSHHDPFAGNRPRQNLHIANISHRTQLLLKGLQHRDQLFAQPFMQHLRHVQQMHRQAALLVFDPQVRVFLQQRFEPPARLVQSFPCIAG